MAVELNFSGFTRGEDIQLDWTIVQPGTTTAEDITGWTFDFKLKRNDKDTSASVVSSTTSIVMAAAGTAQTVIAAAQTLTLKGDYRYALWRTNNGAKACLVKGYFSVADSVHDPA